MRVKERISRLFAISLFLFFTLSLDPFADQQLNQSSLVYALNCVSKKRNERLADDQKPTDRDEIRQAKSVRMKSNQEPEVLFTVVLVVDLIHQEFISLSSREREKGRDEGEKIDRLCSFTDEAVASVRHVYIFLSFLPVSFLPFDIG